MVLLFKFKVIFFPLGIIIDSDVFSNNTIVVAVDVGINVFGFNLSILSIVTVFSILFPAISSAVTVTVLLFVFTIAFVIPFIS